MQHFQRVDGKSGTRFRFRLATGRPAEALYGAGAEGTVEVSVEVFYDAGEMSFLSGNKRTRGIHANITPTRRDPQGLSIFGPAYGPATTSGARMLVLPTARRNSKELERIAQALDAVGPLVAAQWVDDHLVAMQMLRDAVHDLQVRLGVAA